MLICISLYVSPRRVILFSLILAVAIWHVGVYPQLEAGALGSNSSFGYNCYNSGQTTDLNFSPL